MRKLIVVQEIRSQSPFLKVLSIDTMVTLDTDASKQATLFQDQVWPINFQILQDCPWSILYLVFIVFNPFLGVHI